MSNIKHQIKSLPNEPGVYKFFDSQNRLLYVGKAISLKKRVASYFVNKNLGLKTNLLVAKIKHVKYIKVFSEFEALLLEAQLIKDNQPFFNSVAKDDKSPLYIKITADNVPLVYTARRPKKSRGDFIKGPFTSAKTTRDVLKIIRKIFPYCHHKNPKKPCLYVHLGLCPYPYQSESSKTLYIKNIQNIKKLLSAKSKSVARNLTKDMVVFAKTQKFEKANNIKRQIEKIEYVQTNYHAPKDFLEMPTLVDDLSMQKLKALQKILKLTKTPKRIECYDISNISGKNATGSMIVFVNGRPQKSDYRRFKIKVLTTPNDYEMLKEVLGRRFKITWPDPHLIVIDGGKGQLSLAQEIIKKYKKNIPVISLAKRFEEIYTDPKSLPISLPKEDPARQIVQALRDEAHRFAITYHRLLRSKQMLIP